MSILSVKDAASLPSARLLFGSPDAALAGVTTDTREDPIVGKLYFALKGDRQDGHEFLEAAAGGGVGCVLIEERGADRARDMRVSRKLPAAVVVPDTLKALGELARRHRRKLGVKIVAITGSNGKTSTKDFVSSILSTTYRVVSARRSFNNAIGVPLTLLQMTPETQVGVLEMGMNHPGEIDGLCRIADPDLVAITSIAPAHVGFFRSVQQVALAKSEILTAGRPGIPAFLPADSPFLDLLHRRASDKKVSTFGFSPKATWRLISIEPNLKSISFKVTAGCEKAAAFRCPNFGDHQLTNILVAIGIANIFAVPVKKIQSAVSRLRLPPGRGELIRMGRHILIDDGYNANPGSMSASLKRVSSLKRLLGLRRAATEKKHEVLLVLGDMLELGNQTASCHQTLGTEAKSLNAWRVLFIGAQGTHVRRGFLKAGGTPNQLILAGSVEEATPILREWIESKKKLLMLVKASNKLGLEKMVLGIRQNTQG